MTYFSGSNHGRGLTVIMGLIAALFATIPGQTAGQAQEPRPGPPTIRSIDVEYSGPAKGNKEGILAQLRTKVGEPYSDSVVEADIRQLYSTGIVHNVRIFA